MKLRKDFTCPLELVHDMMRGKWKCIIIWRLRLGPTSPSDLLRDIEGITEKMLRQHLREMIDFSLVERRSFDGYPLRTEYLLTENGKKVLDALKIYQQLGIEYLVKMGREDVLREKGLL
ncbi:transcriptional regulator [Gordonibacter sp. An230]|uniref:winged helix-turn-helix transcriptional regulator n=1 Tax=Gordonibacter sp. An230 TaxID=1965592 RepID=UPI000B38ECE8|nr:helix-turn-helix domain-containing protein [Gordonibacter sp. An230]OUO91703.1 transcriptional regulator [Gordonibacter sp. An230]